MQAKKVREMVRDEIDRQRKKKAGPESGPGSGGESDPGVSRGDVVS